ncbi:AraC family transcriptional regulator [Propylenella binzhouense]|uniref:AraC family transcriptional regulator n=1 Tax=Propylenella binzhouense TaxID=2555902 RepID=A0A964T3J6_9HYPH|nr:AraC family transcriptional regulator [Propylenella binzhouense]MYZ47282.1 AraC family transcriptional regulator [Propylenella binzhouense]
MRIDLLQTTVMLATSIRIMADILREEGHDVAAAAAEAGLPSSALTDPLARVSGIGELAFQRIACALTPARQDLWFALGQRYRAMAYSAGGLAMMTAPNLSEMIVNAHVWQPLTYSLTQTLPIMESGIAIGVEHDLTEVPEPLREFTIFRDVGAMMTAFDEVVPNFRCRIEICFPRPAVALPEPMAEAVYDAPRSAVIWGPELAVVPFRHADPVLHATFMQQSLATVSDMQQTSSFLRTVLEVLSDTTKRHSIDEMARDLGMSKRTFQRRLRDHSMSFRDVIGTVRARSAKDLLRQPGMTISEVAWRMGYADATGFSHAFHRWTGLSPRAFRERG